MLKVTLGKTPKSFKHAVSFKLLDGTTAAIQCEFRYRTKREFGEFIDAMFKDASAADGAAAPTVVDDTSIADVMSRTVNKNADYLSEVLVGWDLDVPCNRENLEQLADQFPGAAAQVMADYRAAIVEGRLGN